MKAWFPQHKRPIQMLAHKETVKEVQCSITQPLSWDTLLNRTTRDTVGLFGSRQVKTILCQPGINNIVLIVLSKLIWQLGEAVIKQSIDRPAALGVRVSMCVMVRGAAKHLSSTVWLRHKDTFRDRRQNMFCRDVQLLSLKLMHS